MSTSGGYEFSSAQNDQIGSLANKMSFVGLMAILLGLLNLALAILVVGAVYRDRIPADWKTKTREYLDRAREKLPEDVRAQAEQYSLDKLPANDHLWGIVIGTGATGLFYLLLGTWTRRAAGSFRKVVATRGNDIRNLMDAIGALYSMYSMLYLLLILVLLAAVAGVGLTVYKHFAG
jgi:hypothetical protein